MPRARLIVLAALVVLSVLVVTGRPAAAADPSPPVTCDPHPGATYDAATGRVNRPQWPQPDTRICVEHDATFGFITTPTTSVTLGDSATLTRGGLVACAPGDATQVNCDDGTLWNSTASRWYDVEANTMTPDTSVMQHSTCQQPASSCVVPIIDRNGFVNPQHHTFWITRAIVDKRVQTPPELCTVIETKQTKPTAPGCWWYNADHSQGRWVPYVVDEWIIDTAVYVGGTPPPTASFTASAPEVGSLTWGFDGSASHADGDATITSYFWLFGSGEGNGTGVKPQHTFSHFGVFQVTLIVNDSNGLSAQVTKPVDVEPAASPGTYFHPLSPTRLLDSRGTAGGWHAPLAAGTPRTLTVAGGSTGIPIGAVAVIMNVTATGASNASFLSAYPTGAAAPNVSNLNFAAGQTIPNLVTVKVGTNGQVSFANAVGSVDVIADIAGYFDLVAADRYTAVAPQRILDSRGSTGGWNAPLVAGTPKSLTVANVAGVPATADAVILNVTVTGGTSNSFLTAYPAGGSVPNVSNLNFATGQTIPNLVAVKLGGGKVAFNNAAGAVHVIVDVAGYFDATTGDLFHPLAPARLLDSRGPTGSWNAPLVAGTPRALGVVGSGGVLPGATAVIANTTVTGGSQNSFLTLYPAGAAVPNVSNLNFAAGQTIPNLVAVKLAANGQVAFNNAVGSTHVIFDVAGYFAAT